MDVYGDSRFIKYQGAYQREPAGTKNRRTSEMDSHANTVEKAEVFGENFAEPLPGTSTRLDRVLTRIYISYWNI